jgi:hypothetical protein
LESPIKLDKFKDEDESSMDGDKVLRELKKRIKKKKEKLKDDFDDIDDMGGDTLKASLANMTTENKDDSGLKPLNDYKSRITLMLFPAIFYSIFYLLSFFLPMMRVTEEHHC